MTRLIAGDASPTTPYQYLVLRCVPRVDREEFINIGIVLYCQRAGFLSCAAHLDRARLAAFALDLDLDAVTEALQGIRSVCEGDPASGLPGTMPLGTRFGHLAAPRSTVVQPGPVHGGLLTAASPDPVVVLDQLLTTLVLAPAAVGSPGGTRG